MKHRYLFSWLLAGAATLALGSLHADAIFIPNAGLEDQDLPDFLNASFDGVHGSQGLVPGWTSNEPSHGGAIRVDERYPGRTGQNLLYLHGTGEQNFHTIDFDLGVDLQSHTTYVLTFDVLRWSGQTENDMVIFRAGAYTGDDYETRKPLRELSGEFFLIDRDNNAVDRVPVTLVFTTEEVAPGTKFWIGGDSFGNAEDRHRAHFDNFALHTETRPKK